MSSVTISLVALVVAVLALGRAVIDHLYYKKRHRELNRRIIEAQQNLRRLGDLANEVAHEIKNPITAILCSAEALDLLIGDDISELHRSSLRYIKEYGDNVLSLVSDFLDVSRADAGKISCEPKVVDVVACVETVVGLLDSNAIRKQITINQYIVDRESRGFVDPRHIKQVIFNLIHNAIKFTPAGGEVHVEVKSDFPRPFMRISVKDNGIGIAQDEIDHIFNTYTKCSGPESTLDTGAGIGLSLCKTLVEMCGGKIEVSSTPGVGSSFHVSIPVYSEVEETHEDGASTLTPMAGGQAQPLAGQSFLIIDEDLGSREAVSRLIEAWGGLVDRVGLAVDAVQALENKDYDAVMIDDSVDGIYAHELAQMFRDELKLDDTTIIVTTREAVHPALLKGTGADKLIEKPLNGDRLLPSLLKSGKYTITH